MLEISLEQLVLAAILDDGISPGFIHQRFMNPNTPFSRYLSRKRIDPPGVEEIMAILDLALEMRLVTCRYIRGEDDELIDSLPKGPHHPDMLTYELWFELSPEGEAVALKTIESLRELENMSR